MKALKVTEPEKVEEVVWNEPPLTADLVQTKITKAMLTLGDVLNFIGTDDFKAIIPGSYGVGVVTEIQDNIYDIKRGDRVYLAPVDSCNECYNCIKGDKNKCSNYQVAGDNVNGFLKDFAVKPLSDVYRLPDGVDDKAALFIEYVSISLSIIDQLGFDKGSHIAVIGGGNLGNILSQLIMYYQSMPIFIGEDAETVERAKKSGIYYSFTVNDDLNSEVMNITGGRLCDSVVYVAESQVQPKLAFSLASYGAPVVITGSTYKSPRIDLSAALKKQLNILCMSSGFGNTFSAINLIKNKAVNFENLKVENTDFNGVAEVLKNGSAAIKDRKLFTDTIINLM